MVRGAGGAAGAFGIRALRQAFAGAGVMLLGACALMQQNHTAEVESSLQRATAERDALKAELAHREAADRIREAVFQAYVASTQRHAQSENAQLIARLFDIGLNPADAIGALGEPQAAAGGIDRSLGLEPELEPDVDDPVVETARSGRDQASVLGLNSDLRAFVAAIPAVIPVRDARVSSAFGLRRHPISRRLGAHEGIDFVPTTDRSVLAAGDGVVRFAGRNGGYGKVVVIEHPFGFETHYAHLLSIDVQPGQAVSAAETIGVMGSTGYSTGVHLHFELRFRGRPLDPEKAFAMANGTAQIARLR